MSEKLSERLCEVAGALESTNRMRGIEIARIAQKVAALEQQLAAKYAEIVRLRDTHNERVAQLIAHRVCCGTEHDPLNGKLHGFCVVCGVPWPCEYAGMPIALAETPAAPEVR